MLNFECMGFAAEKEKRWKRILICRGFGSKNARKK
jgi:hypothetical protein